MNRFYFRRWSVFAALTISLFVMVCCLHAQSGADEKNFSREAMVRALAQNVIAPGYATLAANSRALADSVERLKTSQEQAELDRAREAWNATLLSAELLRSFQTGPIADRESSSTFYYWQAIPSRIDEVINDQSHTIDQTLLDNAGATVKGLFAMEYLLFDRQAGRPGEPAESARALDLLSASPQRRAYLAAVARDVANQAAKISADWAAPDAKSEVKKFAADGQASVNLLVNQLTQSIETILENNLRFVLNLPAPIDRQLNRIKGSRSGSSLKGVIAALEGVEKFYRGENGPGLRDSLKRINATLATRVQDKLTAAIAAAREIGLPLERAAVDKRDALQNAMNLTYELEILFKVDLASALGVTITFTSGDGD